LLSGAGFLFVFFGPTLLAQATYGSSPQGSAQANAIRSRIYQMRRLRAAGFRANGVSLRQVIQEAYGIYEEDRLSGGPMWLPTRKFDIQAKMSSDDAAAFKELNLGQRRAMLQTLVDQRSPFEPSSRSVALPVYELVVAKRGPKFHESSTQKLRQADIKGYQGSVLQSYNGGLEVQEFSMPALALSLHQFLGRTLIDKTGSRDAMTFPSDGLQTIFPMRVMRNGRQSSSRLKNNWVLS
jgi:uncharacterized protein (TIGR03435 family)